METLQIVKDKALHAFKNADKNGRQLLTDLFGKKVLSVDVMDRILTPLDVYEDHQLTEAEALPWQCANTSAKVWLNNEEFLRLLFESLNEGWVAYMGDANQRKVYGWVNLERDNSNPAGYRVTLTDTNWTVTSTGVGSRLCLKSDALWKHVFTHFMPQLIIHYAK